MKRDFAVITGASRGLGKSFAERLAERGNNLFLVSLPREDLSKVSKEIEKKYSVKVIYYETDLSDKDNVEKLSDWINETISVNILINNVGIGGTEHIEQASTSYIEKIIQLNILATTILTHRLLKNLKQCKKAYILNISSLAAYSPIGYKTVYPASKAFIYSFSRGLYQELKNTNIHVSVVCPGPMRTNGKTTDRIKKHGFFAKFTHREPKKVAAICLKQLFKEKAVIKINFLSRIALYIVPTRYTISILTQRFKKELM